MKTKFISLLVLLFSLAEVAISQNLQIEYSSSKKYGLKNKKTKQWVLPATYDYIFQFPDYTRHDSLIQGYFAKSKNKYTVVSKKGTPQPGPVFDSVGQIGSKRWLLVKTKGLYSIYEVKTGKFSAAGSFDGFKKDINSNIVFDDVIFALKNKKFGIIDLNESVACDFRFDEISLDYEDSGTGFHTVAMLNGKKGLTDRKSQWLIEPKYDSIKVFCDPGFGLRYFQYAAVLQNGQWKIIDNSSRDLFQENFQACDPRFGMLSKLNGLGRLYFPVKKNGKWGMLDSLGKIVLPFENDSLLLFLQGNKFLVYRNGRSGIVKLGGQTNFPFSFGKLDIQTYNYKNKSLCPVLMFSNESGMNGSADDTSGFWGLADTSGKILIQDNVKFQRLNNVWNYADPDLQSLDDSTHFGWIVNSGGRKQSVVLYRDSVQTEDWQTGNILYMLQEKRENFFVGGKLGIYSRSGKQILPVAYDDLKMSFIQTRDGDVFRSYFNSVRVPGLWAEHGYLPDTTMPIVATASGKTGVVSWKGKEIIPIDFDSILPDPFPGYYDENQTELFARQDIVRNAFAVFKDGKRGYYSSSGKLLAPPGDNFEIAGGGFFALRTDSFSDGCCYQTATARYNYIVLKDFERRKVADQLVGIMYDDVSGETIEATEWRRFCYPVGGKINFQNVLDRKLLLNKWADDAILITWLNGDREIPVIWSDIKLRLGFIFTRTDSMRELEVKPGDKTELNYFGSNTYAGIVFLKYDGKWFVWNAAQNKLLNEGKGFDSVAVRYREYTVFMKGKRETYPFTWNGMYEPSLDLEMAIFDTIRTTKLVVKNSTIVQTKKTFSRITQTFDMMGNYLGDTTIKSTEVIPFVKSGEYNLMTSEHKTLFTKWANEIIFPTYNWESRFSLSDTTSATFREAVFFTSNRFGQSVALRYGNVWRLTTVQHPEIVVDGFDSAKFDDKNWIVTQKGKTLYYSIEGLKPNGN